MQGSRGGRDWASPIVKIVYILSMIMTTKLSISAEWSGFRIAPHFLANKISNHIVIFYLIFPANIR